jgi:hypothetical protein
MALQGTVMKMEQQMMHIHGRVVVSAIQVVRAGLASDEFDT